MHRCKALCLGILLAVHALPALQITQSAAADPIVVEDFEEGIGDWFTNDDEVAGQGPAEKCAIYAAADPPQQGGKQCACLHYNATTSGWASITLPVQGRSWAKNDCSKLSLWMRADGKGVPIRIVLRVQTTRPKRDIAYSQVITPEGTEWQRYHLRILAFRSTEGETLSIDEIQHIKLLQFAKNGDWPKFKLCIDELTVTKDPANPDIPEPAATTAAKTFAIQPDFAPSGPEGLLRIGVSLGGVPTVIDNHDEDVRSWAYALLSDISPTLARVKLSSYREPDNRTYDFDLLQEHLQWIRKCNCRPVVCLDVPQPRHYDQQEKAEVFQAYVEAVSKLARQAAQRGNGPYYEVFDEPLSSAVFQNIDHVVTAYDSICSVIRGVDPDAVVGGPGLASAWDEHLRTFLQNARTLDFLSFHFYGTQTTTTKNADLFETAYKTRTANLPHQLSFRQIRELVQQLRDDSPMIFVTEGAMSSARDEIGRCRDERNSSAFSAAWLAATLLTATPHIDAFLYHQLKPDNWGMMDKDGFPQTPYWAAWLLRHYAPRGCTRPQVIRIDDLTIAAAIKTDTADSVIVATADPDPIEIHISPEGMSNIAAVHQRSVSDADQQWQRSELDPTSQQTILTRGPGVTVLQYLLTDQ